MQSEREEWWGRVWDERKNGISHRRGQERENIGISLREPHIVVSTMVWLCLVKVWMPLGSSG